MDAPENPVSTWTEYYQATLNKPLNPYYEILEPHLPETGRVLELGCGVGHGVLWFLDKGFAVEAVDIQDEAIQILQSRTPVHHRDKLSASVQDITTLDLEPASFEVVVAGFCLFFLKPSGFIDFWPKLVHSVKPGGLFVGQFLGPNDDWAAQMTVHTQQEVWALFQDFDILHYEEADRDGFSSQGVAKHWHVHHVIARRR